ncbi:MAG: peptidylprolyl isomerase [Bacteroidales bacterium]|nr:peptidylprolyl isomerase [Bacteroidales bacterium]
MRKILLPLVFLLAPLAMQAQTADPVVMEVGGEQIHRSEFMREFMHVTGNDIIAKGEKSAAERRAALEEYVELYANFKAKSLDAKSLGMDREQNLEEELARYRKDLAAPYLMDSAVFKQVIDEAYDRNHYVLHAAHILVPVKATATAEEDSAALNFCRRLRQRIVDGEDFAAVSAEQVKKTNPMAKEYELDGDLNCFTVFDMVYPFEQAAYSMQVGELSQPVRTRYGWHLIKLYDKVPFYGKVTFQHFWLSGAQNAVVVQDAYQHLLAGVPFDTIAKLSDDHTTAQRGGLISGANASQLLPEYVRELSQLQEGQFSKPFSSKYGWHIVRLVSRESIPPLEKLMPMYRQKMSRDPRGDASRRAFAKAARQRYGIVDYTRTPLQKQGKVKRGKKQPVQMSASLQEVIDVVPDSVFKAKWRYNDTMIHDLRPLIKTPSQEYNAVDLARYIAYGQKLQNKMLMSTYVQQCYDEFLDSVSVAYADSQLENEYSDFAAIIDEYRRGLMIFNYNERMIWRKAIDDSVGFADFYARESVKKSLANGDDSIYFWRTRARVVVLEVADRHCLDAEKAAKVLRKAMKKRKGAGEMKELLMAKVDGKACRQGDPISYRTDLVEEGHQMLLTDGQWTPGVYVTPMGYGYRAVVVEKVLPPQLKEQKEARGYYLNAWQNEVERQLIADLRARYNVKINYDVVKTLEF